MKYNFLFIGGTHDGAVMEVPYDRRDWRLIKKSPQNISEPSSELYLKSEMVAGLTTFYVFTIAGMRPAEMMRNLIMGYRGVPSSEKS